MLRTVLRSYYDCTKVRNVNFFMARTVAAKAQTNSGFQYSIILLYLNN